MIELSPSAAFALIDLVRAFLRNPLADITQYSLFSGNGFSSSDIIDLGVGVGWFELGPSKTFSISKITQENVGRNSPIELARILINDYCRVTRPPWLQLAKEGRFPALLQAPASVKQLMVDVGLAYGIDDDTVRFWDELGNEARDSKDARLLEIGRLGERLSFRYEAQRTGSTPNWCAIDDSTLGFDIISVNSSTDRTPLTIEVKTSTAPLEFASIFLSRNEWKIAKTTSNHCFHLWLTSSKVCQLATVFVDEIEMHIPLESRLGRWTAVEIPFSAFSSWKTVSI